ncbi:cystatin-C-like [Ailuropoda melanoleuca]|uniref:cystatin-C-like n=1 Tax=Ailuropoda melanoleuca TaxID=9646 RepID=UPI0014941AB7|nr:cystatin-C-like [Ailuropoda melanoleuca]
MAGHLRTPLLLLAALALTLAVSPGTSRRNAKSLLLGGVFDADVNEDDVQQALNFALSEYNKASNDAYHSRAIRVVRARKQVRPPRVVSQPGYGGGAALI